MKLGRILGLITITLILSGCLGGPVKLAAINSYTLSDYQSAKISSHVRSRNTVLVTMPNAAPGYETSAMVYITKPYDLRQFTRNKWVAPPANLLMPIFADQLRARRYFAAVVTSPFAGVANYRVDTKLEVLRQEFTQPVSRLRMVVQVSVINTASQAVIGSRRFVSSLAATGNDPYGGVLAANKAAHRIAMQLAKFVVQVVSRNSRKQRIRSQTTKQPKRAISGRKSGLNHDKPQKPKFEAAPKPLNSSVKRLPLLDKHNSTSQKMTLPPPSSI